MSYNTEVLTDLPRVFIRGGVADLSGNGLHATVVNTVTFDGPQIIDGDAAAINFGGGYLTLPVLGIAGADPWTIELRFDPRTQNGEKCLYFQGTDSPRRKIAITAYITSAAGMIILDFGSHRFETADRILRNNVVSTIAVKYSGGAISRDSVTIIVDGVVQEVKEICGQGSGGNGVANVTDNNHRIGSSASIAGREFGGYLDGFALFDYDVPNERLEVHRLQGVVTAPKLNMPRLTIKHRDTTSGVFAVDSIGGGTPPYSLQLYDLSTGLPHGAPVSGVQPYQDVDLPFTKAIGTNMFGRVITTDSLGATDFDQVDVHAWSQLASDFVQDSFGVMVCWSTWPYMNRPPVFGTPIDDVNLFNPTSYDPSRIVNAAVAAGATRLLLTTHWCNGFTLWPSAVTPHGIQSTTWYQADPTNRDIVAAMAAACQTAGIKFEIYFGKWSKYFEATDANPAANYEAHLKAMLDELLQYPTIQGVWLDAYQEGAYVNTVNIQDLYTYIKAARPELIVRDNRIPRAFVNTDLLVYEELGGYPLGPQFNNTRPGEVTSTVYTDPVETRWFHYADEVPGAVKTKAQIESYIYNANRFGALYMLNVDIDATGQITETAEQALYELGGVELAADLHLHGLDASGDYPIGSVLGLNEINISDVAHNHGNTELVIASAVVANTVNCAAVFDSALPSGEITPGATFAYGLRVTPTALGEFSFDVIFTSNDADSPVSITYYGTALDAGVVDVQTFIVTFGKVFEGAAVGYQVFNQAGMPVSAWSVSGVTEISAGMFSVSIAIPDDFVGYVLFKPSQASELALTQLVDTTVTGGGGDGEETLKILKADVVMDFTTHELVFYEQGTETVLMRKKARDRKGTLISGPLQQLGSLTDD